MMQLRKERVGCEAKGDFRYKDNWQKEEMKKDLKMPENQITKESLLGKSPLSGAKERSTHE
jgi:hypothetical protein